MCLTIQEEAVLLLNFIMMKVVVFLLFYLNIDKIISPSVKTRIGFVKNQYPCNTCHS